MNSYISITGLDVHKRTEATHYQNLPYGISLDFFMNGHICFYSPLLGLNLA